MESGIRAVFRIKSPGVQDSSNAYAWHKSSGGARITCLATPSPIPFMNVLYCGWPDLDHRRLQCACCRQFCIWF